MNKTLSKLGWVVAAGVGGILLAGGFQTSEDKVGVVDIAKVYGTSNLKKVNDANIAKMVQVRRDALAFIKTNPLFTPQQIDRYKVLATEVSPTPADQKELDGIKAAVTAAYATFNTLRQKDPLSAAETKQLQDLGSDYSATITAENQLSSQFQNEMQTTQSTQINDALKAVQAAIQSVGEKEKYTVIFNEQATVYGASDVSDSVQKAVDKGAK